MRFSWLLSFLSSPCSTTPPSRLPAWNTLLPPKTAPNGLTHAHSVSLSFTAKPVSRGHGVTSHADRAEDPRALHCRPDLQGSIIHYVRGSARNMYLDVILCGRREMWLISCSAEAYLEQSCLTQRDTSKPRNPEYHKCGAHGVQSVRLLSDHLTMVVTWSTCYRHFSPQKMLFLFERRFTEEL